MDDILEEKVMSGRSDAPAIGSEHTYPIVDGENIYATVQYGSSFQSRCRVLTPEERIARLFGCKFVNGENEGSSD